MERREFLAHMDELLEFSSGTLSGPERLGDLEGWDSLAVLSFIAMVDEQYGITVDAKQIVSCKTVDELAAMVTSTLTN